MAAIMVIEPMAVPGLHVAPTLNDLRESSKLYNQLPDDGDQPQILEHHLRSLASIFTCYNAQNKFGLHLIHGHLKIREDAVMLGTGFSEPSGCWTKPTSIQNVGPEDIHGHVFILSPNNRLMAYEYREGPRTDMTGIDPAFYHEFIDYLQHNRLASVLGLQVLNKETSQSMIEIVLKDVGTVMLDQQEAKYGDIYRVTGWCVDHDGGLVEFKGNESHAKTTRDTHQVFTDGKPLQNLAALKSLLKDEDII